MSTPGQFGPSTSPPQKSSGLSVLMIILIIFGVLLLLCAGICGGCVYLTNSAVQTGAAWIEFEPTMEKAVDAASNDPQVTGKLGEPVNLEGDAVRDDSGELKPAGEDFHFDLKGPNGTAKVKASAVKDVGTWKITVITVQTSDGTTLNVPPPAASGPDVQFEVPDMPEEK